MPDPKPPLRALLLEGVNDSAAALLESAGISVRRVPGAMDADALARALGEGVHLLGIRSRTRLGAAALDAAGGTLLAVGCFSVGTDQVDLAAARTRGVAACRREVARKLVNHALSASTAGAVNIPQVQAPPQRPGTARFAHAHRNVPGVLGRVNAAFSARGLNVVAQHLQTDGDSGYVVVDDRARRRYGQGGAGVAMCGAGHCAREIGRGSENTVVGVRRLWEAGGGQRLGSEDGRSRAARPGCLVSSLQRRERLGRNRRAGGQRGGRPLGQLEASLGEAAALGHRPMGGGAGEACLQLKSLFDRPRGHERMEAGRRLSERRLAGLRHLAEQVL